MISKLIKNNKENTVDSFFDYSASEKAKIVRSAVRDANKAQKDLVDEIDKDFRNTQ